MAFYQTINHQYTLMYEEFNHYLDMFDMNQHDVQVFLDWMDQFDGHKHFKYIYCHVVKYIMDDYKYNSCLVVSDLQIPSCDNDALVRHGTWTVRVPCVRKIPEI